VNEPTSPLEPRVLELLREAPRPPVDARDRVRARLAASIPVPGGGGHGSNASGASALGTKALVGLALVVGAGTGAALHAALSHPPPPVVVYVDRPVPTEAVASTPAAGSAPSPDAPVAAASIPVSAHPPSAPIGPSQLAAERALLDEARTALVQGDPARALDRLQKHRRSFLNPMLAEERDAMEVEALARLGRGDEARSKADAFRRHSPDSLFMPTVLSAVGSIP
jgi:hypothetical protein